MERKTPFWKKILKAISWIIFVLVFIATASLIICYASGYKINFKAKKIQKNGMILIDYEKNEIEIFLDGKRANYTKGRQGFWAPTNYIISTLPGEYILEIKKEGMLDYSENITVKEEMITKVENVILIPKEIPEENLLEQEAEQYCLSPNNKKLVYRTNNSAHFYNFGNKADILFPEKAKKLEIDDCSWDSESKRLAIKTTINNYTVFYIFDSDSPEDSFFLHDALSFVPPFNDIYFSLIDNNILIGVTNNNALYKINTKTRTIEKIREGIGNIYQKDSIFYYDATLNTLNRFDPIFSSSAVILENIEKNEDFTLVFSNPNKVYIKNGGTIYLVKDKNNLEIIDKNISSIVENNNKNGFFYIKGFELWFHSIDKGKNMIISRFSQPIKKTESYYKNHILHISDKDLGVIRENGENNQKIITAEYIDDFRVLEKENILLITKNDSGYFFKIIDLGIS